MRFEDVEIGMKVVPFQKTYKEYSYNNFEAYLNKKLATIPAKNFSRRGFLEVTGIGQQKVIILEGDYFNSKDFDLLQKKEGKQILLF